MFSRVAGEIGQSKHVEKLLLKILTRLEGGAKSTFPVKGKCRVGRMKVPLDLMEKLIQEDLVTFHTDTDALSGEAGPCRLSKPGRAFLKRFRAKEARKKAKQTGPQPDKTPFKRQHERQGKALVEEGGKTKEYPINIGESPLGWLLRRKEKDGTPMLTILQFMASEKLREDFEQAGLSQRTTANYESFGQGRPSVSTPFEMSITDSKVDARARFDRAVQAMGPGLADSVLRCACFLESVGAAEVNLGCPPRSLKVVLRIELDRLVIHYRLDGQEDE